MAGPTAFPASAIINGILSSVNVLDCGAKGDGVTDDTAAIQAAINSLPDGQMLFFPPGVYIVSETDRDACLNIERSHLTLRLTSASVLKLKDGQESSPSIIRIGTALEELSHVDIIGGVLDGNAENSSYRSVIYKAIYINGAVTDCNLVNIEIRDHLNGGVQIRGKDTSNRAQRIRAFGLNIHDVAEGFELIDADDVQFVSGRIWGMTLQDCFEPARGTLNWLLKDSVVGNAHSSNAPVEIFPGNGGDTTGVIENCYIPGQIRMSVGSGTAPTDGSCKHIVIRNNNMTNGGNIVANVGGKVGTVIIENNILEGPPSSGTVYRYNGMELRGDQIIVRNNSVSGMRRHGIWVKSDNAVISGNRCFNNGIDTETAAAQRAGIRVDGSNATVQGNNCFDSQTTATQAYGIGVGSGVSGAYVESNTVSGNAVDGVNVTSTASYVGLNPGMVPTRKSLRVTIPSGSNYVRIHRDTLGMSEQGALNRTMVQAQGPIAPATHWYLARRVSNNLDLILDAPLAEDTQFILWIDNTGAYTPETLP